MKECIRLSGHQFQIEVPEFFSWRTFLGMFQPFQPFHCYIRLLKVPFVFLCLFIVFSPAGGSYTDLNPFVFPVFLLFSGSGPFPCMAGAYSRTLYSVLRILSAMSLEACPSARYITMSFLFRQACRRSFRLWNPAGGRKLSSAVRDPTPLWHGFQSGPLSRLPRPWHLGRRS